MNKNDVQFNLLNIAANIFEVDIHDISLDDTNETIENWDSLAQLRLFIEIERYFHVHFSHDEINRLRTLSLIFERINNQL